MIESQRLDERQGCAPEEGKRRHRNQHPGQFIQPEKSTESGKTDQRRQSNDHHPPPEAIGQPTPQIRAEKPHQLHLRHQQTDVPGREIQGLEIEPEVGREGADEGEIKEVIAREAPVGQSVHPMILPDALSGKGAI